MASPDVRDKLEEGHSPLIIEGRRTRGLGLGTLAATAASAVQLLRTPLKETKSPAEIAPTVPERKQRRPAQPKLWTPDFGVHKDLAALDRSRWEVRPERGGSYTVCNRAALDPCETRPVYLVKAGFPGHPVHMRALMEHLDSLGVGVIGVPTPGFYDVYPTTPEPSWDAWAAHTAAIIDNRTIDGLHAPYVVVAHSMGGLLGAHLTAIRSDRIAAYVPINSIGVPDRWSKALATPRQVSCLLDEPTWSDRWEVSYRTVAGAFGSQSQYWAKAKTMASAGDGLATLSAVGAGGVPSLVLKGNRDRTLSRSRALGFADAVGAVAFIEIDGVHGMARQWDSHGRHTVLPQLFTAINSDVEQFIAQLGVQDHVVEAMAEQRQNGGEKRFWVPKGRALEVDFSNFDRVRARQYAKSKRIAEVDRSGGGAALGSLS